MKGERMARIYVPLDKNMSDKEIVAALREAAEAARSGDTSEKAEEATKTLPDEVTDE
jgi:hypothetical protein